MRTEVQIVTRSSYGRVRHYPANTTAEMFCILCKSRCLGEDDLTVIENLGFAITYVAEEDNAGNIPKTSTIFQETQSRN